MEIEASWVYLVSEWLIRLSMLVYVPQRRPPAAARTWLLLIFLFPWPGLLLYLVIGKVYLPRRRREWIEEISGRVRQAVSELPTRVCPRQDGLPPQLRAAAALGENLTAFPLQSGNRVEVLTGYEESIDRLVADIRSAREHVHLLTYIYGADEIGGRVSAALEEAAARGVTCRLVLDAYGSKGGLGRFGSRWRRAGIEVTASLPVGLRRRNRARIDLRNHRKVVVIDGRIGHIGSQNIVSPDFVPGHPNQELVARIEGPAVAQMQAVFLCDRFIERSDAIFHPSLFPEVPADGPAAVQVIPAGPGYRFRNLETLVVSLVHGARHRVGIVTPYFVPSEPLLDALRTAVLRGVSVHLLVSAESNQRFTILAQRSYFEELLEAGVRIHWHRPRFLHAKLLTIDDSVAMFGSANMDIRSFALNAEVGVLVDGPGTGGAFRAAEEQWLADSSELTLAEWRRRPWRARVAQNIARLADSLL